MINTKVKICGITNLEDALSAIKHGADALGFVFYEKSPRYIKPEIAGEIIKKLPPFVEKVGLFVNVSAQTVNEYAKIARLTLAQIHFHADVTFYRSLDVPHLKVVRANCREDILKYNDEYRLVDSFVEGFGGEGKSVDMSWFEGVDCSKIILAGGLNVSNIDSFKKYNFYGFDVSSAVEREKGLKDEQKVEKFIEKAKN
ncbi:MAG: phosphoribosylanthranilate isomerase [Sulfurospirillaceae bacterium]|nr:phosphoribosylanthranilate isomerase [Sulfurospirillaceae bacterium]